MKRCCQWFVSRERLKPLEPDPEVEQVIPAQLNINVKVGPRVHHQRGSEMLCMNHFCMVIVCLV